MSAAFLAMAAIAAARVYETGLPHVAGGVLLLLGSIAMFVLNVRRDAISRQSPAPETIENR